MVQQPDDKVCIIKKFSTSFNNVVNVTNVMSVTRQQQQPVGEHHFILKNQTHATRPPTILWLCWKLKMVYFRVEY